MKKPKTEKVNNTTHNQKTDCFVALFGADIFSLPIMNIVKNILGGRGLLYGMDYNRIIELPESITNQYQKIWSRLQTIDRYKTRDQHTFTREQKRLRTLFRWIEKLAAETRKYVWNTIYQTIQKRTEIKKINLNTTELWEEFSLSYHRKPKKTQS